MHTPQRARADRPAVVASWVGIIELHVSPNQTWLHANCGGDDGKAAYDQQRAVNETEATHNDIKHLNRKCKDSMYLIHIMWMHTDTH